MSGKRVVMVVDMQNGVFATPRHRREACVALINQLTRAADTVIFIQHIESGGLEEGSEGFQLLPDLYQPDNALYVTKTACDSFYRTRLAEFYASTISLYSSCAAVRQIIVSIPR
jgi:nicotinamidase-related amidase